MLVDTATRLAVVNLMCPATQLAAESPVYPTMAGPKVYDSRLDPDDAFSGDDTETGPVVVVYTEETKTIQRDGGEAIPHRHFVKVTIMASFYARSEVTLSGPDGDQVAWVDEISEVADAWQEMTLDTLAAQIHRRMTLTDSDAETALFQSIIYGIEKIESTPLRDPSRTSRYATRTLEYWVETDVDMWPTDPAATGLDALPFPLSAVATGLPVGSKARANCERVAAQMRAATAPGVPLAGISVHFNADDTVPARDPDSGVISAQMRVDATT